MEKHVLQAGVEQRPCMSMGPLSVCVCGCISDLCMNKGSRFWIKCVTHDQTVVQSMLNNTVTYLDQRSSPRSTQHCHLSGIDAVGPVFTRVVHAQDSVQHVLLLTVARGRDHTVGT